MKAGKIMKILVIILVAVIIGGIISMMYIRKNRDKFILDGPGMIYTRENKIVGVSYSYGGGMEAKVYITALQFQRMAQLLSLNTATANTMAQILLRQPRKYPWNISIISVQYVDRPNAFYRHITASQANFSYLMHLLHILHLPCSMAS